MPFFTIIANPNFGEVPDIFQGNKEQLNWITLTGEAGEAQDNDDAQMFKYTEKFSNAAIAMLIPFSIDATNKIHGIKEKKLIVFTRLLDYGVILVTQGDVGDVISKPFKDFSGGMASEFTHIWYDKQIELLEKHGCYPVDYFFRLPSYNKSREHKFYHEINGIFRNNIRDWVKNNPEYGYELPSYKDCPGNAKIVKIKKKLEKKSIRPAAKGFGKF